VADKAMFARLGHALLAEMMPLPQPIRLMGLTLSSLEREPGKEAPSRPDGQLSLL
jgi:DNA polymerase-4